MLEKPGFRFPFGWWIAASQDYYDILEVPKNASEEAAKKARGMKMHEGTRCLFFWKNNMGVSENRGISPQIIHGLIGISIIFTIHFGGNTTIFGNTHMDVNECDELDVTPRKFGAFKMERILFNFRLFFSSDMFCTPPPLCGDVLQLHIESLWCSTNSDQPSLSSMTHRIHVWYWPTSSYLQYISLILMLNVCKYTKHLNIWINTHGSYILYILESYDDFLGFHSLTLP